MGAVRSALRDGRTGRCQCLPAEQPVVLAVISHDARFESELRQAFGASRSAKVWRLRGCYRGPPVVVSTTRPAQQATTVPWRGSGVASDDAWTALTTRSSVTR